MHYTLIQKNRNHFTPKKKNKYILTIFFFNKELRNNKYIFKSLYINKKITINYYIFVY